MLRITRFPSPSACFRVFVALGFAPDQQILLLYEQGVHIHRDHMFEQEYEIPNLSVM